MKVLVVGANGQVGREFVKLLSEDPKHQAIAMIRSEEQISYFNSLNVETVLLSLEESVQEIAAAMEGCDAVVFTAGSGGSTGADKTLLIDLDGAAKTIEAAQQTGTDRFLMVSAIYADRRENWSEDMAPYYVAKHHADNILRSSGLAYTIVRPGGLTNDQATGKIRLGENLDTGTIPREDVARVLFEALSRENLVGKTFEITSGDEDISDALNQV
ncbi:SDR family oxidoreductase [Planococcus sp. YIM B11945]|uniref:SDR family oxidoreductase n=1 Tax=Planococcus sp. YIM B11945 TaxID=3435410 RepID=UPI003D7C7F17